MRHASLIAGLLLLPCLGGCAVEIPQNMFEMPVATLAVRQVQSRQYLTTDEKKMISASAGVLQDLGFTLDESETKLGLVLGSKDRDATDQGQVTLAAIAVAAAIAAGTSSDALERVDKTQKLRACVVTHLSEDKSRIVVRVTFQRIVWNARGQVNRLETLNNPKQYQEFFNRLSKAVFLEEQSI